MKFECKKAPEYYQFQLLLNILIVTLFMTSSISVLQALIWEKLSVHNQIVIKNLKMFFQTNNFT